MMLSTCTAGLQVQTDSEMGVDMPSGCDKRTGRDKHLCKWEKICGHEEGKVLAGIGKERRHGGATREKIEAQGQHDIREETEACLSGPVTFLRVTEIKVFYVNLCPWGKWLKWRDA